MASTFKTFLSDDIANTRTLLHEAIPLTRDIVNGTSYGDDQVKTFAHGMFQSVYDFPFTSSSANHIFDLTFGHHQDILANGLIEEDPDASSTVFENIGNNSMFSKRKNIYNQMAQVLVGHKINGEVMKFDIDGDLTSGSKYNGLIFINFARLLGKDEIKKGTFSAKFATAITYVNPVGNTQYSEDDGTITITDEGSATNYKVNSPAGEFGILKITATSDSGVVDENNLSDTVPSINCGLIFYQAGIAVLTPGIFDVYNGATSPHGYLSAGHCEMLADASYVPQVLENDTQDAFSKAVRQRLLSIDFSNTTELNSTIYFCRVGHNDFNYSTNPTYLQESRIRIKDRSSDAPVSYITTVGLYSSDNELLAVAKLSEPLRKDPTNDITLRVRLDY